MSSFKRDLYDWTVNEPMLQSGSLFKWYAPLGITHELGTGAVIGPYLTMKDFKQIHCTYPIRRHDSQETKEKTKNDRTQKLMEIHDAKMRGDPHAAKASIFQELLDTAKNDLEIRKHKELQLQLVPQRERFQKKLSKVQDIHKHLKKCIGNAEWKAVALDVEWRDPTGNLFRSCAEYQCSLVEQIMGRFISSPSSCTKKAIMNIAQEIRQVFNAVYQGNFFSYSFFNVDDKWENALRLFAVENLPPSAFWERQKNEICVEDHSNEFKSLVLAANFRDAFAHRMRTEVSERDGILSEIFARVAHDIEPVSHAYFSREDFRSLARVCYNAHHRTPQNVSYERTAPTRSLNDLKEDFEGASTLYDEMKRKVQLYLNREDTREFIEEDGPLIGEEEFTRREVVRRAILRRGTNEDFQVLRNEDFTVLIHHHRRYYFAHTFRMNARDYYWLRRDD